MAIPLLLGWCAIQAIVVALALRAGDSGLYFAIAFGVFGLLGLAMLLVFLLRLVARAGQMLDPMLTEMGLQAEAHLLVGRRYRGEYAGRAIDIEFMPAQWNRRALLNIRLAATVGTRMAFFHKGPLLDCADCPPVLPEAGDLAEWSVRAEDPDRARGVLGREDCRAALRQLSGSRDVYVQSEQVWLRVRANRIDAASLRAWMDGLTALADCMEWSGAGSPHMW
jgi:hypothetical protein